MKSQMDVDDVLMHFGILGMHWGRRKGTQTSVGSTKKPKVDKKMIKADKKWAEAASSSWVKCHNAGANEMNTFLDSLNKKYSGKLDKDMWDKPSDKWSSTTKAYVKEYDTAYQNSLNSHAKKLSLNVSPSGNKELKFEVHETEVSYNIIDKELRQSEAFQMDVDDVLAHYGVPGMKWGHKKGRDFTGGLEKVKKTDLEEINQLFNKLSITDRKFLVLDQKLPLIKKNIRDERHCFVSRLNGKIVGFMRESGRPEGFALIEELVVDPNSRNKGVASKMLKEFHSSFPKTLAKTKADNEEVNKILKKNGYKPNNPDAKSVINWVRQENPTQKSKQTAEKLLDNMTKEEDQNDVKHGGGTMEVNDVLAHYGVPGMKWGHRKAAGDSWLREAGKMTVSTYKHPILTKKANRESIRTEGTKTKLRRKFGYQNTKELKDVNDRINAKVAERAPITRYSKNPSADHVNSREIKRKPISEMSNKELRELNERLQLERNYASLAKRDFSSGSKFVDDVLKESGKETAKQYTKKAMVKAVETAILL